mmetsp:Transcript_9708/g.35555  ORF Transcript_9708/g.35555 Transcript_9708/m.35555 type:complete len:967 (-) Transcript_9708:92-2992(-)
MCLRMVSGSAAHGWLAPPATRLTYLVAFFYLPLAGSLPSASNLFVSTRSQRVPIPKQECPASLEVGAGLRLGFPYDEKGTLVLQLANNPEWREEQAEDVKKMFYHSYDAYVAHAWGMDELRPISCTGSNTHGGIALTLIDSLDTLIVLGNVTEFNRVVRWLSSNLSFDVDVRVSVFEVNIRALGGLLSAHTLIEHARSRGTLPGLPQVDARALVPEYDGQLLDLAQDLAERLMPAFNTPTGIPLAWVNLRKGAVKGDTRHTCTAGAGTLLLEFMTLSQLSGNPLYGMAAKRAARALYERKSRRHMMGNTISCDTGKWIRKESSIGAGIDSYFEYLLKAYLLFGEEDHLVMFAELYASVMGHMTPEGGRGFIVDVNMDSGKPVRGFVSSLSAFWPGMQVLVSALAPATSLHSKFMAAWNHFGYLPEQFDPATSQIHPRERGYPLRPELIESTYFLSKATNQSSYVVAGRRLQAGIQKAKVACGYASLKDVGVGIDSVDDHMESFFLSETLKYLFLLYDTGTDVAEQYIFTTEGHLLPIDGLQPQVHVPTKVQDVPTCDIAGGGSLETSGGQNELSSLGIFHPLLRQRRCKAFHVTQQHMHKFRSNASFDDKRTVHEQGGVAGGPAFDSSEDDRILIAQAICELAPGSSGPECVRWLPVADDSDGNLGIEGSSQILVQISQAAFAQISDAVIRITAPRQYMGEFAGTKAGFGPSLPSLEGCGDEKDQGLSQDGHLGVEECTTNVHSCSGPSTLGGDESVCDSATKGHSSRRMEDDLRNFLQDDLKPVSSVAFMANPIDACQKLKNTDVAGQIALVRRGDCSFVSKARNAQLAGAAAMIVVNNDHSGLVTMATDETDESPLVTIPSAMISRVDGRALQAAVESGQVIHVDLEGTCPGQADSVGAAQEATEGDSSRIESRIEFSIPKESSVPLELVGQLAKSDLTGLLQSMDAALRAFGSEEGPSTQGFP